jgi:hypothetical protein
MPPFFCGLRVFFLFKMNTLCDNQPCVSKVGRVAKQFGLLCDDLILETLTFLHPLSWIPIFQKYLALKAKWLKSSCFPLSPTSYMMFEDIDINNYFYCMRNKFGTMYKKGILDLLAFKQANPQFSEVIEKRYNYDMEAVLRLLDPSIFSTFQKHYRAVLKDIKRHYRTPTHSNEGCLCCQRTLPSWYPMFGSLPHSEIKKQVGKRVLKSWAKETKNMIQLGCCSELCYLVLYKTQELPKPGDNLVCGYCFTCDASMTSFNVHMASKQFRSYEDLECNSCRVEYCY